MANGKVWLLWLMLISLVQGLWAEDVAYAIYSDGTLTFSYGVKPDGAYSMNVNTNNPDWQTHATSVTAVVFDASFADARPTSCYRWFRNCSNLENIEGIENLNTSQVITMLGMFQGCSKLSSLDLSHFDTSKVTSMFYMFNNCSALTSIDLSGFETQKVSNMEQMFYSCSSLTSIDLSCFNTSAVTNMNRMFARCSLLKTIYASTLWNTGKVTNSDNMFYGCSSLVGEDGTTFSSGSVDKTKAHYGIGGYLTERNYAYATYDASTTTLAFRYDGAYRSSSAVQWDASNTGTANPGWLTYAASITDVVFDVNFSEARPTSCYRWFRNFSYLESIEGIEYLNTSQVSTMATMFAGCSKLSSLDLSHFNTSKVTSMYYMFANNSALTSVDLSSFDTSKVINMGFMFYHCEALTELDLSSFNTSAVTNMERMFANCNQLKAICVDALWNTDKVTNSDAMFSNCHSLVGEDGTTVVVVNKTNAHYGTGGYLTRKTADVTAKALDGDYWTTYFKSNINRMADARTTVYTVRLTGSSIALEEVNDRIIEAGQGVVLKSSNATITLTSIPSTSMHDYSANSLHGTEKSQSNPAYGQVYVLNRKTGGLGFYKLSSSGKIGANKAYLLTESAMERESFLFDDQETTAITPVQTALSQLVYNLHGHRMVRMSRGMNIINGKKYLKK